MNKDYLNTDYIKQTDFKYNVIGCINPSKNHTIFFVDDVIFKNYFDFYDKQMDIFNENKEILCRSLRLHPNLTFSYPERKPMKKPNFLENNIFYWRGQDGDYGYPMSLDGHIFRTQEIYSLIKHLNFNNPNILESNLATFPLNNPKMICYEKSIIVNNPCNKVQTVNNNIHGNVDPTKLNDIFLSGRVISLKNIDGIENISCHQEIDIIYE